MAAGDRFHGDAEHLACFGGIVKLAAVWVA